MQPLVVSHRTNAGTHAENTIAGIEAALEDGADAVEFDLRATTDGALVLLHDPSLLRTAGDPRAVDELTLAELRSIALRDGRTSEAIGAVPLLNEALEQLAGRAIPVIDVKAPVEAELAIVLASRRRSPAWAWTHDLDAAARLRRALPASVRVALIVGDETVERHGALALLDYASSVGLSGLVVEEDILSGLWVEAAEARGLECYCGNVTRTDQAMRAIRAGVRAICTDTPRLVIDAREDLLIRKSRQRGPEAAVGHA